MALQYTTTHRSNAMSDIVTAAGGTAYILIYSGTAANVAAAAVGTLLASLPCSATIGTVTGGVLTFNAITSATAAAGTAAQWRLCTTSAGTTCIAQGTVGTTGSDLNFASGVTWTAGQTVSISSWTITAFGS